MTKAFFLCCWRCRAYIRTNKLDFGCVGGGNVVHYMWGQGQRASTMSFISLCYTHPNKLPSLEEYAIPIMHHKCICPKTQTQKSKSLIKSEGIGHTFIRTCPLASLFFCAFCYLVLTCFLLQLA